MKNTTNNVIDIKQTNYQNIYQLFFAHSLLSKPQIAQLLNLSLPTVVHNINKLENEGKIQEQGMLESQGGRPATAYSLVKNAFIAIGVEIQKTRLKLTALNLKTEMIALEEQSYHFSDTEDYDRQLGTIIKQFITKHRYDEQRILGIGISIQGIVANDHRSILYSEILHFEQLNIHQLQSQFHSPIYLLHDVKCAASMEIWQTQNINDAFYVSISEHLGGTLILNNKIEQGKNGFSGALEHLQLNAEGKSCYCGQKGCLETYCSLSALLDENESLADFFAAVRRSEAQANQRWTHFLQHLAQGLKSVYLLQERDIILGGDIAPYLTKQDVDNLQNAVRRISPFPIHAEFIKIAKLQEHATVCGAALPFIVRYLEQYYR
ncbi:ROK family transcriptional regulator [Rodentibacter myodis]|uniref:Sugar kinase n=1 Tax=Rodentibacter myodis TaxID=1907939 RepID=A0A1V3JN96_9PAST|nr:ROK family transcriptional regulator [Rodentibacter myodis]OOF58033.1 sugar kinase [Rodentibacter myodis]